MQLKQENAADDTAAVIGDIVKLFQAMELPRLADARLYLGAPFSILEGFSRALSVQRSEDSNRKFINRMRYAGIARERTADTFLWDNDAYPYAQPGAIESALSIDFIRRRNNLIVAGPPGAGKTLLTLIVACKALREGYSVKYKTGHDIAVKLQEAREGNSLSGYIKRVQSCDVLVIEDLTFSAFNRKTATSFFSIIDGRYGRKTTIVTSNSNLKEWARNLPVKEMGSAILGRFYEEALLVNMNGAEDMRLKRAKGMLDDMGSPGFNEQGVAK